MSTVTMDNDIKIASDELLRAVALELMYNNPAKWQDPEGPTAQEIARRHNASTDEVKKKLKILQDEGLARTRGMKPKRWQFDEYVYEEMDTESTLFCLISRYDDEDYEKYYIN